MGQTGHVVTWRGVTLGTGAPRMAIPAMGASVQALEESARRAAQAGADVVELRLDSLCPMPTLAQTADACAAVRRAIGDAALLLTLRTVRDGGAGSADAAAYEALLCSAADAALCDALDVETSVGAEAFARIAARARAAGVSVVGSSHDFTATPPAAEIVRRLCAMADGGAQVCKIAVMPQCPQDVLTLAQAAQQAAQCLPQPRILIAMGALGVVTRVCCEALGSCLTFATAGQASAPGQVDAQRLRAALEAVHAALGAAEGDA